jgi:hypothetical protein
MLTDAQSFALQRSAYARTLRQWASAQRNSEARWSLMRLADVQDRAVDVLLNLTAARREETLH